MPDINWELRHIKEQCEKEQYWNAIASCVALLKLLLREFDKKLKA